MSEQKLLFIDVETTGTDPQQHGLIQVSGCVQIGTQILEEFDYYLRPFSQDLIEDQALQVTGIDRRQLLAVGDPQQLTVAGQEFLDPQDVYARLSVMFGRYVDKFDRGDKFQLVGYNAHSFDMPFLRRFWEKNGDRFVGSWFWYPCLDVMLVWAQILQCERGRLSNFKLASVARHCGLNVDESRLHDSGYDIELTRQLWLKACAIIERGQDQKPLWIQGKLFDV